MTALKDVRVLDLSSGIAGPMVGMWLGDFGADVIKVESPAGDWARRRPGFAAWNRNKRGVTVDPASNADIEWLVGSIKGADICILGTEADLDETFGRRAGRAAMENTGLIELSLPPCLTTHTPWRGSGESNGLLSAFGGQARRQSSCDGGPVESVSDYMLNVQAAWAATCTVAALVERRRSGKGQRVTVSGMNGLSLANAASFTFNPESPDVPTDIGPAGRHPTYRHFECGDGLWLSCGALGAKFEAKLLEALGLGAVLEDPRIAGDTARMLQPGTREWCTGLIKEAFLARPRTELLELLASVGIPAGPLLDRGDWLSHPQILAIGMREDIHDTERGDVTMPGIPIRLEGSPGSIRRPAPALGQDNGVSPWPAKPAVKVADGGPLAPGPLHGYRILNMGTFVATPYAGFLLSELGADVIKAEPLEGDPFRATSYTSNRGMRSLSVDLKTQDGRAAFRKVVAGSDAVIDGMRPGAMRRLGLDYESLVQVNPGIITLSLSAFGEGGPLSGESGVDMVIQAMSGMMVSQGGKDEPVANTIAINDVAAAALSALACVLALYRREVSGQGQRTWNSLAGTSAYLQLEELVAYRGRPEPRVGGQDFRGAHCLQSYYKVADGWIYIDTDPHNPIHWSEVQRELASRGLLTGGEAPTDAAFGQQLADALALQQTQDVLQVVQSAGLRCIPARTVREVVLDPLVLADEVIHIRKADDGSIFVVPGKYAGFSRTQRRGPLSPPGIGEHTQEILSEAGVDEELIARLLDDKVITSGGRMAHLLTAAYR